MLKKMLMLATAALAIGCGGGGGDGGFGNPNEDPIGDFVRSTEVVVSNQDLNGVGRLISQDYLENCVTRNEVLDAYADVFNDPDVDEVFLEVLDVQNEQVDWNDGIATFNISERFSVTRNGQTTSSTTSGVVTLVYENGVWRELGNQQCNRSAPGTPKGVFGGIGASKK